MLVVPPRRRLWRGTPTVTGFVGGFDGWVEDCSREERAAFSAIDLDANTVEMSGVFPALDEFSVWAASAAPVVIEGANGRRRCHVSCGTCVPVGRSLGELVAVCRRMLAVGVDVTAVALAVWRAFGRRYYVSLARAWTARDERARALADELGLDDAGLSRIVRALCPLDVRLRLSRACPSLLEHGELLDAIVRVARDAEGAGAWCDFPASCGASPVLCEDAAELLLTRPWRYLDAMWSEGASSVLSLADDLLSVVRADVAPRACDMAHALVRVRLLAACASSGNTVVEGFSDAVEAGFAESLDSGLVSPVEVVAAERVVASASRELVDAVRGADATCARLLSCRLTLLYSSAGADVLSTLRCAVELLGHDRVWVTGVTSAAVASFARTLGVPDRAATVTASVMSHAPDLASSRVVVVVDANLADVSHVSALVRACPSGTVLLVGDADGLAPVGVGDAFVDLLSSNACVCESARARACDARRLCERVDAGDARGLLRELGGHFVSVTEGTWSRVATDVHLEEMDEVASSVLMCPYRTHGEIDLLNKRLAERFGLGERVSELADVSYRIGDVVRCARADDSAVVLDEAGEVVDGAVLRGLRGRIEGEDGGVVRIALDDGGVALVHVGTLFGWHHAWAETVHASAVRRWQHVTLVVPPGHVPEKGRPFVSACLLHAAIAAAHGSFSLVADASEVERALSWRGHGRRTHLRDLLGSCSP